MTADRRHLARLNRLERVRAIARQTAANEAAAAESALSQITALAERTRFLAAEYAARAEAHDGYALREAARFAGGLQGIASSTAGDVDRARALADAKLVELGLAERRRAVVETRAGEAARRLARAATPVALGGRREGGAGLARLLNSPCCHFPEDAANHG